MIRAHRQRNREAITVLCVCVCVVGRFVSYFSRINKNIFEEKHRGGCSRAWASGKIGNRIKERNRGRQRRGKIPQPPCSNDQRQVDLSPYWKRKEVRKKKTSHRPEMGSQNVARVTISSREWFVGVSLNVMAGKKQSSSMEFSKHF